MGRVLHGSALTTEVVRRAIQHRRENQRVAASVASDDFVLNQAFTRASGPCAVFRCRARQRWVVWLQDRQSTDISAIAIAIHAEELAARSH